MAVRAWIGFLVLILSTVTPTPSVAAPSWGHLELGAEAVGFKTLFVRDRSRPWHQTRPYGAAFRADLDGRPLQINLWYPAVIRSGKAMRFGDYVHQETPPDFVILGELASKRSRELIGGFPNAIHASLLADPVAARSSALPKRAKYPLVLLLGGLGADLNSNFVLAEYLASHGYVVASLSLLGPDEGQPDQSRSRESVEANVRDLEFATPLICASINADCQRLAVAGHSVGAVIAALFANRNSNVSATIALDGTYGFKGSGDVLTQAIGYAPRAMRAALLDLRRAEGSQSAELDLSPVLAFSHADLSLVTLPNVHHSDFTSFAIMADRYDVPTEHEYDGTGWTRATGRLGYEHAARIVLAFLNDAFSTPATDSILTSLVAVPGASFRQLVAAPPVPSPSEAVAIAADRGLPALKSLIEAACRNSQPSACIDQQLFNSSGYNLISTDAAASVVLFEIVAWAHPRSANAQDSLADGYLATNRQADARCASVRSVELALTDPALDDQHRREIIETAERRIEALDRR